MTQDDDSHFKLLELDRDGLFNYEFNWITAGTNVRFEFLSLSVFFVMCMSFICCISGFVHSEKFQTWDRVECRSHALYS